MVGQREGEDRATPGRPPRRIHLSDTRRISHVAVELVAGSIDCRSWSATLAELVAFRPMSRTDLDELEQGAIDAARWLLANGVELDAVMRADLAYVRDDADAPDNLRDAASNVLAAATDNVN